MDDKIYQMAIDSIVVMKDLSYARSRLEFWRERYEHASSQITIWEKELKRLDAKNKGEPFEAVHYATY